MKIQIEIKKEHFELKIEAIDKIALSDFYYFSIDHGYMENEESLKKCFMNMSETLYSWLEGVQKSKLNMKVFLPFDFSDQYLGCLAIIKINNQFYDLYYGVFNNIIAPLPSYCRPLVVEDETKFIITSNKMKIEHNELIENINSLIKEIQKNIDFIIGQNL